MAGNAQVLGLLEEMLDSGKTPEEVCRDCPELLLEVRKRWQAFCRIDAQVGALLPGLRTALDAGAVTPEPPSAGPLQVPGYQVEAVLGRGGMGVVYKARQHALGRSVALKMLLLGPVAGSAELGRFRRETMALACLRHANIVQVYDAGDVEGRPYFAMEFVEGGSLAQKLAGTPQPARQAAALLATLAEAVQVAHQGGILHRDLKPANILLTADGTPKIADFGLARRLDGGAGLTQSGVPMGTPSYMAPEQARGQTTIGPAVDVYALGAILYELLTGRPPFQGETAAATIHQVVNHDPVPPSRLNFKIPRDLETICLKCLQKAPPHRYASARALADDLRRFGEGRPIQARRLGPAPRLWRWCRRSPALAALVATALVLVGLASGGGVWLMQQQADRRAEAARNDAQLRNEVGTALAQGVSLRQGFHFHEARQLLEQARQRLEPAGPDDLRRQVEKGRGDLDLTERLDTARMQALKLVGGEFNLAGAEPLYTTAFAEAALAREEDDVEAVAARVRESTVREEIVAALDDWASITRDRPRRAWLLAAARASDPDPVRDQLRQPDVWRDAKRLTQLARELSVADLSPQLATALGRVAIDSGGDAVPFLTAVHARFPQDFWLNFQLACALGEARRFEEALSYVRAALALRPTASVTHEALGDILRYLNRFDEAIGPYEEALRIEPNFAAAHCNLGLVLCAKGRHSEGIEHYRRALRLVPNSTEFHNNLGVALKESGQPNEAIDHYQEALRIEPNFAVAHIGLGAILRAKGQLPEAIGHFQEALRIEPESTRVQEWLCVSLYPAARASIHDATRPGSENARPGELEQSARRRQALGWLRTSLELTTKLKNVGKLVDSPLSTWQTDPALASVRDPRMLAKLPDAEREQWQRLWVDVAAHVAADPLAQGRACAARQQWTRAADRYARALMRGTTEQGHFWFEYAALSLLSGDRPGYARACARMIERCGKDEGPRAYHVARACTLAPDAVADASMPGRLAEKELQRFAEEFWSLTEQGALAYRTGRYQEAVPLFEKSLRADPKAGKAVLNWLWLALAHQRLGKSEEARRWLGKATTWLEQYHDGMPNRAEEELGLHLHNWLEANVLRREAESIIPADLLSSQSGK
jgi:serine/threonine-protein kinase